MTPDILDTALKCACLSSRDGLHQEMIESFQHKGLRKLYEDGEARLLPAGEVVKIKRILSYLEAAEKPQALHLLGYRFHQSKGCVSRVLFGDGHRKQQNYLPVCGR
jgi:hypothetical protein